MFYQRKPIEAVKFDGSNQQEISEFIFNKTGDTAADMFMQGLQVGDYIAKGVGKQLTLLKSDVFEQIYEPAE
jgi:hypothetical protein